MIKNVFLDLDDTILDFQKGERKALIKTFDQIGIPIDEEIIKRYVEINLECWRALERGEMTKAEVLVGRFSRLFREMNIDFSPVEAQDIYENLLSLEHDFLPGAEKLLDDFAKSKKYTLYMATNGTPQVQIPRISDTGVGKYFKEIFISEKVGYAKPNPQFFKKCFEKIEDFKPEETIIVGDSLSSDIKGGLNSGILTCHYNPNDKPYFDIKPHYTIKNLDELIPLLDNIK